MLDRKKDIDPEVATEVEEERRYDRWRNNTFTCTTSEQEARFRAWCRQESHREY